MKNIVICVSLTDDSLEMIKKLKGSGLIQNSKIHLIHCFETQVYTGEYFVGTYPEPSQYLEIEKSINKILDNLGNEFGENIVVAKRCLFSSDGKAAIKDYLESEKADLAIIATRGKHGIAGLFSSSFAEYMVRYSPCDLHILRP